MRFLPQKMAGFLNIPVWIGPAWFGPWCVTSVPGGSCRAGCTITMQVTRNFLLSRERKFSRKIKEIILALQLEKVWAKQKILHVYLNEIYLGESSYGVEAAARCYFDKPVEHLSVAEAALIAGLVAGPARFNPFKNEEVARQKQATVLARMLKAGFINDEEYQKAKLSSSISKGRRPDRLI